jgi:hypothetical protein
VRAFARAACAVAALLATCKVSAAAPPPGHAILARPGPDALFVWDASRDVATIVADRRSDDEARALLERDALRALAAALADAGPDLRTVTVRIVYDRTGAVSPVYGAATFAGVERYATVRMSGADAAADRDRWRELGETGALPAWPVYTVSGVLPPR